MSDEKKPLPEVYVSEDKELAVRVIDYYLQDYDRGLSKTTFA